MSLVIRTTRLLHFLPARVAAVGLMFLFGVVAQSQPVPFREVAKGSFGGWLMVPPRECAFTSEGDFAVYWTNSWRPPPDQMPPGTAPEDFPVPALPPVDWNKEMVIAVSKGTSPTSAERIWVETIEENTTNLVVSVFHYVSLGGPAETAIPFQVVAISRIERPVVFRLRSELRFWVDALYEPPDSERLMIRWSNLGRRFSYVLESATSVTGPWSQMPNQTWPTTNISHTGVLPQSPQRFMKFTVFEAPGPIESCTSP